MANPHVCATPITTVKHHPQTKKLYFDCNSFSLLVDNGASASITNTKDDFIDTPTPVCNKVNGIFGDAIATIKGTVKWKLEDDSGRIDSFVLKNTYLKPNAATQVLLPQHLAQEAKENFPLPAGTGEFTSNKSMILTWNQCHYKKTIPLDSKLNIGITRMASGSKKFAAFPAAQRSETEEVKVFETHIIPDTEDDDDSEHQPSAQIVTTHSTQSLSNFAY